MLVLPAVALAPLAEAGRLLAFKTIVTLWRAPGRLTACSPTGDMLDSLMMRVMGARVVAAE